MYLNDIGDVFYMGLKGCISTRLICSNCPMQIISQYFLRQRMAYRVDLLFCTTIVKGGDCVSVLLKQRVLYIERGDFAKKS